CVNRGLRERAIRHSIGESSANLIAGSVQAGRKNVFQDRGKTAKRRELGNVPAKRAGANHSNGADLAHGQAFSRPSRVLTKLGSELRIYSARRLRSSAVMVVIPAWIRRRVAAISST